MRKIKIPSKEEKQLSSLADENAELMMQSAMQGMEIADLKDMNAELMIRLANLEKEGN